MKLNSVRNDYTQFSLSKQEVAEVPHKQFGVWLDFAFTNKVLEPTAMSLSTIGTDGFPQNRIVLLKHFDELGFTFFTNYHSEKGKSILINPKVSLHFFWPELERQVRILGTIEKTTDEISDKYFNSRPIESRIAAIVSNQSEELKSRKELEIAFNILSNKKETPLKRPQNWGGYLVKPVYFEFWQGRKNRMHDRIVYEKRSENWFLKRLAP